VGAELVWRFLKGEKSLAPSGNEPQFLSHPNHGIAAILTTLFQHLISFFHTIM
jgi:hypothetical protein